MKKDVIYIDIEDDITSVIDKLKNSREKIVALVPPKGNAVLQSVVNLKLLKRAATSANKQLVVVTSNQALTALAGGLELYVAKNLQSKPVLAGVAASEPVEDEALEVSDTIDEAALGTSVDISDENEVDLSSEELAALDASDEVADKTAAKKPGKSQKGKKVPNFDSFRKKLLIGGGIVLLLMIISVAVFGRAKAQIVIRAETTPVDVAVDATFSTSVAESNPETNTLKAVAQEKKQTISQSFTPTGQKDVGQKATGKMKLTRTSISSQPLSVPAGTQFTSGEVVFVSNESAQLAGTTVGPGGIIQDSETVTVTAAKSGDSSNVSPRAYQSSVAGVAAQGTQMNGGTTQIAKVVTQQDINNAKTQLEQQDSSVAKAELAKSFGEGVKVLDDTFTATIGAVTSEPAVDQPANEAKLTAEVTYTMLGVSDKELGAMLDEAVVEQMTNKEQQRVYDNGLSSAKFEMVSSNPKVATYKVTALAQYGPQFDTEKLKSEIAGKKFGEARSYLQDLPGVKGVDMKLSPFWARKLPAADRITIELEVDNNNGG